VIDQWQEADSDYQANTMFNINYAPTVYATQDEENW
jgi:hypothetical protein